MFFDFSKISVKDGYKLLSYTVVPRPIAWVVTQGSGGRRNAAPFSFFNIVATAPPLVALGMTENQPHGKDTARNIAETGQFVVNLVPHKLVNEMNITAIPFDASVDELATAGLSVLPSSMVVPPRIAESPVAIECEVFHIHELESGQSVVLGRVLAMHVADEAVLNPERCYIDTSKLDIVGRMDARYLRTDSTFDLPRISVDEWVAGHGA